MFCCASRSGWCSCSTVLASSLPPGLVRAFGNVIPFAEVMLGFCVLFGVVTTIAVALMGILLIALTFGMVLVLNPSIVANNLIYCVIVFLLLYLPDDNAFSLDQLWKLLA